MGVSRQSLGLLREQIESINDRCKEHGIPRPTSFAYPGNAITPFATCPEGLIEDCRQALKVYEALLDGIR